MLLIGIVKNTEYQDILGSLSSLGSMKVLENIGKKD